MSAFEDYIQLELPQRPVLLVPATCSGYDGDPNGGGAPVKIQNSPLGTLYLRTAGSLYQKLNTTPGTWLLVGGGPSTGLSSANRDMSGLVTGLSDGVLACATPLATTIAGWIEVQINGLSVSVGNGTKTGVSCYFSADGGTTAKSAGSLTVGDYLYWNHSVASYSIATSDRIDFIYG